MKLDEYQLEYYGARMYQHFFKLDKYQIIKFESPDFIIWKPHKEKIGFEFCRPSNTTQNIARNLINKYFGRGLSIEDIIKGMNSKERKFMNNGTIGEFEGTPYISPNKNLLEDSKELIKLVTDILFENIINKTKKLNDKYTLFDKHVLYILRVPTYSFNEIYLDLTCNLLNSIINEFTITYNQVVIDLYDSLIVHEKINDNYIYKELKVDYSISKNIQMESSLFKGLTSCQPLNKEGV